MEKIIEKVKCKLCGDIITLVNDDQWMKCKCGCTELRMDNYGFEYVKANHDDKNWEVIETHTVYKKEDYLIPNEELTLLMNKVKNIEQEYSRNHKNIFIEVDESIDENEDSTKFLNEFNARFFICENKNTCEYNDFKIILCFNKEDLHNDNIIDTYISKMNKFIKLYNYFNDLNLNDKKMPKRKEIEKQFYNDIEDWEYISLNHYDVDYYI